MGSCTSVQFFGPSFKKVEYEEIKKTLGTGDLILFSGRGKWSEIVKSGTYSFYSHIGIIIKTDYFKEMETEHKTKIGLDPDNLYLWHSQTSEFITTESVISAWQYTHGLSHHHSHVDLKKGGVQLNPLGKALESYDGVIVLRKLKNKISAEYDEEHLIDWLFSQHSKAYSRSIINLMTPVTEQHHELDFDDPKLSEPFIDYFCSELVSETLKKLKVFPQTIYSTSLAPTHFSKETRILDEILLAHHPKNTLWYTEEKEVVLLKQVAFTED